VEYLLEYDLAEPWSAWSSPRRLVSKPDVSYRSVRITGKLNDCVARVGEANFVSKFDLLLAGAFDQAC